MNKEIFKLLKSAQKDEKIKDIPKEIVGFKDVTIEYVMENVTNYKEFCKVTGLHHWEEFQFYDFINPKKICAQEKLNQIESFFNKDEGIDWFNKDQRKWFIWFDIDFHAKVIKQVDTSGTDTTYYDFNSIFPSQEVSKYVAKTFINIYMDLFKSNKT